ncbi:TPA: EpsG family protein [Mannheimia haemolytica]|nr:EpsG family protein [Mannheimia haemolytica]
MYDLFFSVFNFVFPILGLYLGGLYFFLSRNLNENRIKIFFFNLSYSLAMVAFLYNRTNETGDIYHYFLFFNEIKDLDTLSLLYNEYISYYYSWVSLLKILSYLEFDFKFINFICVFIIYYSCFSVIMHIYSEYKDINTLKIIIFKVLTMVSIITVVSSYRNILAFSVTFLGVSFILKNNLFKGCGLCVIGVGFHPSAIIIIICLGISRFLKFRKVYLYVSSLIGVFPFLLISILSLLNIPFLEHKTNEYIYGQWASYKFESNIEYIVMMAVYSFVFFVFFSVNKLDCNYFRSRYSSRIINFMLFYFTVSLFFIQFKTLSDRFMFSAGGILLISLSYFIFYSRVLYRRSLLNFILLFIWFLYIDSQLIHFSQKSYVIGDGFPYNFIYSPLF